MLATRVAHRAHRMLGELVKYGLVGLVAFVVDVGTFNLLRFAEASPLTSQPLTAKALSVILATTVAFVGHRHWTFVSRGGTGLGREYTLFLLFSAIGLTIALACLAISHYVLDFTSVLADNISANGVGLVLGTVFRFWAYRQLVFPVNQTQAKPGGGP